METKVETLENNQVKFSFNVEASEVDARIKKAYRQAAKRYNIPGFRPGKAPRPVIDSMFGSDAILTNVTEDLVNEVYPQALEETNLIPLVRPDYEYELDLVKDHQPFNFTATITIKPSYELSSYDAVEAEIPAIVVSEEEIDAQIDELRNYYHEFKNANANTKVKPGEFVEFTCTATDSAGEEVAALSAENRLYELGRNVYPASFDAELIGLKKGGEKSFDLDLTEDDSTVAGGLEEKGLFHFEVTINAIKKKVLPEVTDEWASENFGFESVADMREKIAGSVRSQKEMRVPRRKENECLQVLGQRLQGELPQDMCESQETKLLQDFYGQLSSMGITFDQYLSALELTADQFKEDNKKQAADIVRQDLALDAWARHYEIECDEEEVHREFTNADLEDPEAIENQWREEGRLPMIRESLVRAAALRDVMAKAVITEVEPEEEAETAQEAEEPEAEQTTEA